RTSLQKWHQTSLARGAQRTSFAARPEPHPTYPRRARGQADLAPPCLQTPDDGRLPTPETSARYVCRQSALQDAPVEARCERPLGALSYPGSLTLPRLRLQPGRQRPAPLGLHSTEED